MYCLCLCLLRLSMGAMCDGPCMLACLLVPIWYTYRTYACMCTHAESFKIADEAAELAAALSVASSHHMYAGDGDGGHTLTPAARRSGTHAISTLCRYMYV